MALIEPREVLVEDDETDAARRSVPGEHAPQHDTVPPVPPVADPAVVLCEHGYLRRPGWCGSCQP